ncbi:MAG TPA: acylphosphatase [Chloroflexia bacterium]|nr:acylphosphatase [Chloroflexia bacterium]
MGMDRAQVQITVRGRVQGVGFRMFVRDAARRLGLSGWVRNAEDGSVLVQAAGTGTALEQLLQALQHGPPAARVDTVLPIWGAPGGPAAEGGFEVRG